MAGAQEIVVELLDTRLVGDGWVGERAGARRLGRVLAGLAMDEVEALGLGVVGLEVGIGDRPRRRHAAVVLDLLEVALAKAEENPAVDLGAAADEVLRVRSERVPMPVVPALRGDVSLASEHLPGVPVLGLARKVSAALEQEDLLARRREAVRERAADGPRPDGDHVGVAHPSAQRRATGEAPPPVAPRSFGWLRISANSRTPSRASSDVSRFSTMNTPWRGFRTWGVSNGRAGAWGGARAAP